MTSTYRRLDPEIFVAARKAWMMTQSSARRACPCGSRHGDPDRHCSMAARKVRRRGSRPSQSMGCDESSTTSPWRTSRIRKA